MFAATAAGSEPPVSNPKNLPPALATVAGDPIESSSASTSASSIGGPCNGRASFLKPSRSDGAGETRRSRT
jgi:hypothetical protein